MCSARIVLRMCVDEDELIKLVTVMASKQNRIEWLHGRDEHLRSIARGYPIINQRDFCHFTATNSPVPRNATKNL